MQTTPAIPNPLDGMTDDEINAMPEDAFYGALSARMESQQALLTCEQLDEIEALWESERCNRRCALVLLTKPWAWVNRQVTENRDFAVAVARIKRVAEGAQIYKRLAELTETVSGWATMALASREDIGEVLAEADATMGE